MNHNKLTLKNIASNYELFQDYLDPYGMMTVREFNALSLEERIALMKEVAEGGDPEMDTRASGGMAPSPRGGGVVVLNFSHPLTPEQIAQAERLSGQTIEQVITLAVQFDNDLSYLPQLKALMDQLELTSETFQNTPILVNPPSLNFIACLVLAELHGRMGYFPPVLRLRRVPDSLPPRFEVAEILNLQAVRDDAREGR